MKYKLLSVHRNNKRENNIGDYIQALAASQFMPSVDGFINREELRSYSGEDSKVIMNGWFMHNAKEWPPSNSIKPLFVAFHLNQSVKDQMLVEEGIDYLKRHEPIGCRDLYTRDLLLNKGVDAYFSGCLTLTLGNKYKLDEKDGGCFVVDPIIPEGKTIRLLLKDLFFCLRNHYKTHIVCSKLFGRRTLSRIIKTSRFLRLYSNVFDLKTLVEATYIEQQSKYYTDSFDNDGQLLAEAEKLVKLYASAKLVITSRIHCALPCLGLDTPVYFLHKEDESQISACRFGGLIELFNAIRVSSQKLAPEFVITSKRISLFNVVNNKQDWQQLAESLSKRCNEFIKI